MSSMLEQLHAFIVVAETGTFSGAARQLQKAQSAISTTVANLEIDLGVTLFERSRREPVLTAAGEDLLVEARAVLMRCNALKEHAATFAEYAETELVLALDNAVSLAPIARALEAWQAQFPAVTLHITHPAMPDVPRQLATGEIDLAVMLEQSDYPEATTFCRLGLIRMVEVAHREHPLASASNVSFTDLAEYRQLVFAPHGHALATSEYVISPRRYTVGCYFALIDLLRAGLGWAMVPYRLVAEELTKGLFREIDLAAYPYTDWLVGVDLLWNRESRLGRAGHALRHVLTSYQIVESESTMTHKTARRRAC